VDWTKPPSSARARAYRLSPHRARCIACHGDPSIRRAEDGKKPVLFGRSAACYLLAGVRVLATRISCCDVHLAVEWIDVECRVPGARGAKKRQTCCHSAMLIHSQAVRRVLWCCWLQRCRMPILGMA
jgi:hypothetical protein